MTRHLLRGVVEKMKSVKDKEELKQQRQVDASKKFGCRTDASVTASSPSPRRIIGILLRRGRPD